MAQLAPGPTELPQLLVCPKSPLPAMLVIDNAVLPLLVKVTVWAALAVPTF
jgi:hypothetical protein